MKRAFDVSVAFLGLVASSPIIAAAAVAVMLESRGPAFYSGPRVGRNGVVFKMHKLRTMRVGTDSSGPLVTASGDARVTTVGRWLRRTKADELPQLWNVLKGEMSLVGPRPEHPDYVKLYTPEQRAGLSVRPGITGPSAIAFINEEEMLKGGDAEASYVNVIMPQKLALDLDYVRNHPFERDLMILVKTAALLVRRPATAPRPKLRS